MAEVRLIDAAELANLAYQAPNVFSLPTGTLPNGWQLINEMQSATYTGTNAAAFYNQGSNTLTIATAGTQGSDASSLD